MSTEPVWMRVADVSSYLQLSDVTVRKLIHNKQLPASRVGVEIRINRDDLDEFIKNSPVVEKAAARDGRRGGKKPGRRAGQVSGTGRRRSAAAQ